MGLNNFNRKKMNKAGQLDDLIRSKDIDFDSFDFIRREFGDHMVKLEERRIHPVKFGNVLDYNAMIKIAIKDLPSSRVEYKNAHEVFKELKNTDNVVHLLTNDMLNLDSYPGMLMELGVVDLQTAVDNESSVNNNEIFDAIISSSKGVADFHRIGYSHREIRPSQMILIPKRDRWCISDYGLAKNSDDTRTAKNNDHFKSPELVQMEADIESGSTSNLKMGFEEDIYQIGVSLYTLITGDLNFISRARDAGISRRDIMYNNLNSMNGLTRDQIRFIKKLTGPLDNSEFGRYRSLRDFIDEYEQAPQKVKLVEGFTSPESRVIGKIDLDALNTKQSNKQKRPRLDTHKVGSHTSKLEESNVSKNYSKFEKQYNLFNSLVDSSKYHKTGKGGTLDYKAIDDLVNSYTRLEELSNLKDVRNVSKRNDLLSKAKTNLNKLKESDKLICSSNSFKDFLSAVEISFLWGPPNSTYENPELRKTVIQPMLDNIGEIFDPKKHKSRYTLKETLAGKTHYHKLLKGKV